MKKLKKTVSLLAVLALALAMVAPTAYAVTPSGTKNDVVWIPKITDVNDMTFTVHSNGSDVQVEKDTENNAVTLTYTSDETDVENRQQTEVRLDTSAIPGYNHYVSFDIAMDKHADFVATMDLEDVDNIRPYSLYIGSESWTDNGYPVTVSRVAALQHDPDKEYVKGGTQAENNKGWWTAASVGGFTWTDTSKPVNVKLLSKAQYSHGNAAKEQIVYVYLNGKCVGQTASGATTKANEFFNFDTLRLIHYATAAETQSVTISNIQMGYVSEGEGYYPLNKTYTATPVTFPKGDKVYVKLTLPTTKDVAWDIIPGGISGKQPSGNWSRVQWNGICGIVGAWTIDNGTLTEIKGFDENTGVPQTGNTWLVNNCEWWGEGDGTAEITVILDRKNGTMTMERAGYPAAHNTISCDWATYESGQTVQFRTGTPTYTNVAESGITAITNVSWNTANFAVAIESGVVMDRTLDVKVVNESDGIDRVIPYGFGNADGDQVDVIFVHRNEDGTIKHFYKQALEVKDGLWWLGQNEKVKKNLINTADTVSVYIWDSVTGMKPVSGTKTIDVPVAE